MEIFETNVQLLRYKVLKEVARQEMAGTLKENMMKLPEIIIPGPKPTTRCCIYKERAIIGQRIQMAMGGMNKTKNEVEVLSIACDECPVSEVTVSDACRGCIAHRCDHACPKDAITHVNQKAVIDHTKCIVCGRCVEACPYNAITKNVRPCERACKPGALKMGEDKKAHIDDEKCVSCGACVYQCPFGAVSDKSYILNVIHMLQDAKKENAAPLYAVVAPSITGQFVNATTGQVAAAMKKMGFTEVYEAALGADLVAYYEAKELEEQVKEHGYMTSSCCPAFVKYIRQNYPKVADHISSNPSPMVMISEMIKAAHPDAKIVFVGPCVAKKGEVKQERASKSVNVAITFEELNALLDAAEIEPADMPKDELNNASYFGRIFARSGGLSEAVGEALAEQGISEERFKPEPVVCSGLDECKVALLKAQAGKLEGNFIEGMACTPGCIGGPGCLTHGPKEKAAIDRYGQLAKEKRIDSSLMIPELLGIKVE